MDNYMTEGAATTAFKLTFNLPAENHYFSDEGVTSVRVSTEGGIVRFKSVKNPDPENGDVEFSRRARGGFEIIIDGSNTQELFNLLTVAATKTQPFFLIKKLDNGWLGLQHYKEDTAPPKFTPHVRIWFPKDKTEPRSVRRPLDDEIRSKLGDFVDVIRVAHDVLKDYEQSRQIGRPPQEIIEARAVIDAFTDLAREIIPESNIDNHIKHVKDAAEMLNEFLKISVPREQLQH